MAVFYKWIKGCEPGADLNSKQWTYLHWGKEKGTSDLAVVVMPTLKITEGKDDSLKNATDLGYLLTNKMPTPRITNEWNFNSAINFIKDGETDLTNGPLGKIHANSGWLNLSSYKVENSSYFAQPIKMWGHNNIVGGTSFLGVYIGNDGTFDETKWRVKIVHNDDVTVDTNGSTQNGVVVRGKTIITTNQATDVYNNFYAQGGAFLGAEINAEGNPTNKATATFGCYSEPESLINFYRTLKLHGKPVEAPYFNATSDQRAKENIRPATYSALALVNKLPIYNFNYKNNSETVTGILAQDLLAAQPKELDLVSNINATGENNDYMSIKNDKLMFVLMKAIQEQQEQIEALKLKIASLENR